MICGKGDCVEILDRRTIRVVHDASSLPERKAEGFFRRIPLGQLHHGLFAFSANDIVDISAGQSLVRRHGRLNAPHDCFGLRKYPFTYPGNIKGGIKRRGCRCNTAPLWTRVHLFQINRKLPAGHAVNIEIKNPHLQACLLQRRRNVSQSQRRQTTDHLESCAVVITRFFPWGINQ